MLIEKKDGEEVLMSTRPGEQRVADPSTVGEILVIPVAHVCV